MGKIFAIVNQKGGVGKTTTAVNLSAALHELGQRTLLCDFDPQANATSGLGIEKRKIKKSIYDVLMNEADPAQAVVHTDYGDVLPACADLAGAAVEMIGVEDREHQLKTRLDALRDDYDMIFIDCPPLWSCSPSTDCVPPMPSLSRYSANTMRWRVCRI